ncbi:ATP-binding protein [Streptomyces sp. NPDC005962]|uniref:ATP-binding protein n=1 Tax=Streptomyces sp. NPDC005962 TaxID=3154466 RepID=UPI0033F5247F
MTATPAVPSAARQAVPRCFEEDFLPEDRRVPQMRRITTARLRHWGLATLVDSATLIVSELVTNAIQHGRGRVELKVMCCGNTVRIEVTDGSPAPALMRTASVADENGRGLRLVAALSEDWGVSRSRDGKMVWATLALPEGRA